jgi:hypothetical protein
LPESEIPEQKKGISFKPKIILTMESNPLGFHVVDVLPKGKDI